MSESLLEELPAAGLACLNARSWEQRVRYDDHSILLSCHVSSCSIRRSGPWLDTAGARSGSRATDYIFVVFVSGDEEAASRPLIVVESPRHALRNVSAAITPCNLRRPRCFRLQLVQIKPAHTTHTPARRYTILLHSNDRIQSRVPSAQSGGTPSEMDTNHVHEASHSHLNGGEGQARH